MHSYFKKILLEKACANLPEPTPEQWDLASQVLRGKNIGQIRTEFPAVRANTVMKALRAVRDAVRIGNAPDEFKQEFPEIVAQQLSLRDDPKRKRMSAAIQSIRKVGKEITATAAKSFHEWIVDAKVQYAKVTVPLTVEKMMEGVESNDSEMIKLSSQMFGLVQTGGKGINIGLFAGSPGPGAEDKRPRERQASPFFEQRLRLARQRIDKDNVAAIEAEAEEVEDASP